MGVLEAKPLKRAFLALLKILHTGPPPAVLLSPIYGILQGLKQPFNNPLMEGQNDTNNGTHQFHSKSTPSGFVTEKAQTLSP